MPSLRELQEQFARGVLAAEPHVHAAILENGLDPARRLNIYRNNVCEGFLKTLEATFPVVLRLAGRDWFRQVGIEYMRCRPSASGNLHYVGQAFAAFLDDYLSGSEHAYFADAARLEWAYQEVLVAADHLPFDTAALASVPSSAYGGLRFTLHPALRLIGSVYPLLAIWRANRGESDSATPVRLDAGPSRLLIIRRNDHVELRELPSGEFALLEAFARGLTFESAAAAALASEPNFDLSAALIRIVQLRTLVGFEPDSTDP